MNSKANNYRYERYFVAIFKLHVAENVRSYNKNYNPIAVANNLFDQNCVPSCICVIPFTGNGIYVGC
jgi:hypothetical protein